MRRTLVVAGLVVVALGVACFALRGRLAGWVPTGTVEDGDLESIRLPAGFAIHLHARAEGVRSLCRGPDGIVFAGSRQAGKVYALVDGDGDQRAETVHVLAEGLTQPNGVAYRDGDLYVAEIGRVLRFPAVATALADPPEPEVVTAEFPTDEHHGWKFIAFGPDGLLYVPVGAPCNVCDAGLPYAAIHRMRPDGTGLEPFAAGIRNTVGFDWHPQTGVLWFTDNGRDWLGDDRPPDELNRAPKRGLHFGFPHVHGRDLVDPEFGADAEPDRFTPPAVELGPHVAALGMRFYTGTMFPERWRGGIFIAEHGSWNRSDPLGYRVTFVPLTDGEPGPPEVFAEGWLAGGVAWGRPVDVLVQPDGALLVSDDKGGVVYRIHYVGRGG